jgi:hypothetical protein
VSSISGMSGSVAIPLDQTTPISLVSQNFPRIDHNGGSMAFVWKQFSNGVQELAIQFTENISSGINSTQEIVDSDNVGGVDVMLNDGTIWVVWEDEASGMVKYRSGSYTSYLGLESIDNSILNINVKPNPSADVWTITGSSQSDYINFELVSVNGEIMDQNTSIIVNGKLDLELDNTQLKTGIYYLKISTEIFNQTIKLVKL